MGDVRPRVLSADCIEGRSRPSRTLSPTMSQSSDSEDASGKTARICGSKYVCGGVRGLGDEVDDAGLGGVELGDACDTNAMWEIASVDEETIKVSANPALCSSAFQWSGVSEQCSALGRSSRTPIHSANDPNMKSIPAKPELAP